MWGEGFERDFGHIERPIGLYRRDSFIPLSPLCVGAQDDQMYQMNIITLYTELLLICWHKSRISKCSRIISQRLWLALCYKQVTSQVQITFSPSIHVHVNDSIPAGYH